MGDIAQFEALLQQLMSPDNNIRGAAEANFKNATQQAPDQLMISLLQLIRTSQNQHVRELATVLLRRTMVQKEPGTSAIKEGERPAKITFWSKLSDQVKQTIQNELLHALESEQTSQVRKKLGDTISDLALFLSSHSSSTDVREIWADLLPFLLHLVRSENVQHRICSLDIFSKLCLYIGDTIKIHFNTLKDVLFAGLTDKSSVHVRTSALSATVSFIQLLETREERDHYKDFIPVMFDTLSATLAENETEALDALQTLVELADVEPTFLRPHLPSVVTAMLTIASSQNLDEAVRQLGLEFLITLAERAPGMIRKLPEFVDKVVPVVLNFMLDLDDSDEWNEQNDDEDDAVDVSNSDVGDECLDRLALNLGGKALIPVLFKHVGELLRNPDWKHRHTGLMAVSLVAEGCVKFLTPHLGEIIELIIPGFNDAHPRVRWAACNTAGQLSTDFGPVLQAKYGDKILPALIHTMGDNGNVRVQSHSASAVINFCEHARSIQLEPFMEPLMNSLLGLLKGNNRGVQEQAITAVAAISDVVKDKFIPYYDVIVPMLKNVLYSANGNDLRMLRGKALECLTLVAFAVGKEKFMQDAKEVLDILLATQQMKMLPDDPQIAFLRNGWARICNTIGRDFDPYLKVVVPVLLEGANLEADMSVIDTENSEQDGYDYIPIGDKKVGLNTSVMEEKAAACNMIFQYASALKAGYFPYVPESANILIPLIKFYFHDGVRAAATAAMPALVSSVKEQLEVTNGDKNVLNSLFSTIFDTLIPAIGSEIDIDVLLLMIETLAEILEMCGPNTLTTNQMQVMCEMIKEQLSQREKRMKRRLKEKQQNEDFDEEELEKLEIENEKDEEALSEIADCIGKTLKWHSATFAPFFQEHLLPLFTAMIAPNKSYHDKQVGVCVFDDAVEFGGLSYLQMMSHFLPFVLNYIGDESAQVRQAAVYGIGVCAQFGGEQFASGIPEALKRLVAVISLPNSRDKDNASATENAISAVGKICRYQSSALDLPSTVSSWFNWLPVVDDVEEAKVIYGLLCYFIESIPQAVFGEGFGNLPKVLNIFATVLGTDYVNEEVTQQMVRIMQQMQTTFPADLLKGAVNVLPQEMQGKLSRIFS